MLKIKQNSYGFAHLVLIVGIVVVASGIGGAGHYVKHTQDNKRATRLSAQKAEADQKQKQQQAQKEKEEAAKAEAEKQTAATPTPATPTPTPATTPKASTPVAAAPKASTTPAPTTTPPQIPACQDGVFTDFIYQVYVSASGGADVYVSPGNNAFTHLAKGAGIKAQCRKGDWVLVDADGWVQYASLSSSKI
jgi:cytoskeletal protein RodZ